MRYKKLGRSGLEVSAVCLGCMSFGDPAQGGHQWVKDYASCETLVGKALEQGINFFDTANSYNGGSSEVYLGKALRSLNAISRRDELVIATKVYHRMGDGPNRSGLSRKAILQEVDNSLRRLGVDYIDLYQVHRWDTEVEMAETLQALDYLVRMGKVRYLGASSMPAWLFMKAIMMQRQHGWAPFVSMQNHLNLIYREEEREMLPLCRAEGLGIIPWSPLARGRLVREASTDRAQNDRTSVRLYDRSAAQDALIIERVAELAARRGISRAQIALAWVLQVEGITSPIVGASSPIQFADAVKALEVVLSPEDIAYLQAPYSPHEISGHN